MTLNQERIFALKLHALHQEDREWILSQLDAETQSRLAPLLDELDELGFEIDPTIFDELKVNKTPLDKNAQAVSMPFDMESLAAIDAASPSQIEIVFDQEPGIFLQTLKAIRNWKWTPDFSAEHSVSMRQSLPINSAYPSVAVRQALIKAVARQLPSKEYLEGELRDMWEPRDFLEDKRSLLQQWRNRLLAWKQ